MGQSSLRTQIKYLLDKNAKLRTKLKRVTEERDSAIEVIKHYSSDIGLLKVQRRRATKYLEGIGNE